MNKLQNQRICNIERDVERILDVLMPRDATGPMPPENVEQSDEAQYDERLTRAYDPGQAVVNTVREAFAKYRQAAITVQNMNNQMYLVQLEAEIEQHFKGLGYGVTPEATHIGDPRIWDKPTPVNDKYTELRSVINKIIGTDTV